MIVGGAIHAGVPAIGFEAPWRISQHDAIEGHWKGFDAPAKFGLTKIALLALGRFGSDSDAMLKEYRLPIWTINRCCARLTARCRQRPTVFAVEPRLKKNVVPPG